MVRGQFLYSSPLPLGQCLSWPGVPKLPGQVSPDTLIGPSSSSLHRWYFFHLSQGGQSPGIPCICSVSPVFTFSSLFLVLNDPYPLEKVTWFFQSSLISSDTRTCSETIQRQEDCAHKWKSWELYPFVQGCSEKNSKIDKICAWQNILTSNSYYSSQLLSTVSPLPPT